MKRVFTLIAAFAAVALLTVAAQADSRGEQVFNKKCAMCHVVKGKGGAIGPELRTLSARLSEKDIKAKIVNPRKANPASSMPGFATLPQAEMESLVGYLKTLR